jgi:Tol biopolymer transport system component
MAFSPDGTKLAAEARISPYDYTIVVNGVPWSETFGCVWTPIFNPKTSAVIAPVMQGAKWTLAQDGKVLWDRDFVQCWHQMFSADASKLAAIVAPKFSRWTIAVDGQPWRTTFGDMVTDAVFSPDGSKVAALGKEDGQWTVIVDDAVWPERYDMAWAPIFSPDGNNVGAKVEKNGSYTVVINGKPWKKECEAVWDPTFSLDGSKVLIRSIEGGKCLRRVLPIAEITG